MRTIFHVDMDAFYAAIEQRDDPSLRGRPVVVGSAPDKRGVVCTASYEARRYGIRSAMPSRTAYARCPGAVFLRPRMSHYAEISRQLMAIFHRFTPQVEALSIDEAFMDMTSSARGSEDARVLAGKLKATIRRELGLTGSVGIAPNKFLAKLASDMDKPDGLTLTPVDPAEIAAFLAPLPVERIWGVGKVTAARLRELNLCAIGDIQRMGREYVLTFMGGNLGEHLWRLAHGIDERRIEAEHEEKSISNEDTFGEDCADMGEVRRVLLFLAEKVGGRLRQAGKRARTAQIKIRFSDFRTITRQRKFPEDTDRDDELLAAAKDLFEALRIDEPVRLVGFGVQDLLDPATRLRQPSLFAPVRPAAARRPPAAAGSPLDAAIDELREKYGAGIIVRGIPREAK